MTTIHNAERRKEYKRTQEQHQKPRPAPHSRTRRGDQPPPTERSRAPDTQPATSAGNNGTPPAGGRRADQKRQSRSPSDYHAPEIRRATKRTTGARETPQKPRHKCGQYKNTTHTDSPAESATGSAAGKHRRRRRQ